jgi:transcriptional regulator with XRE-family HTH domain
MTDKLARAQAAYDRELERDTGPELAALRVAAGLDRKTVAARMGIGRQRIAQIESASFLELETCRRYREALSHD